MVYVTKDSNNTFNVLGYPLTFVELEELKVQLDVLVSDELSSQLSESLMGGEACEGGGCII